MIRLIVFLILAQVVSAQTLPDFPNNSFALYAMARADGVPAPTREARERVWALLEEAKDQGTVLSLTQTRLGFEGAKRICATFATSDAARVVWDQARSFVKDADLVTLVIEPCDKQE